MDNIGSFVRDAFRAALVSWTAGRTGRSSYIRQKRLQRGEVFEAKTDTHGTGEYHGYPLEDEDVMHEYVKSIWEERCQSAGQ